MNFPGSGLPHWEVSASSMGSSWHRGPLTRAVTAAAVRRSNPPALNARARPVVRHARALVEPAVVEALDDGEDVAREATARFLLGRQGRAEWGGQRLERRGLVDPREAPVAQHDLAGHHYERDA